MANGLWYVRRGLVAAWMQCYPVGRHSLSRIFRVEQELSFEVDIPGY